MSRPSIYDSSIDSLLANTLLLRARNNKLTVIYVEGNTDFDYFYNFFDKSKCHIEGCRGKSTVIQIINKSNERKYKGVIGILDKDYDQLLSRLQIIPNLFYTDEHDMECMILKTEVFERLINKFTDSKKCKNINLEEDQIQSEIISIGKKMGAIRRYNELFNLGISFKELNFEDYLDDELLFDVDKIIEIILRAYRFSDPVQVEEDLNKEISIDYDTWQVCRGHDITELVKIFFTRDGLPNIGNPKSQKEINTLEKVEDLIQIAYGTNDFKRTELYSELNKWEKNNSDYEFLKS